ncbi:hypothetical protein [Demequina lutea]|uniref:Putative Mrr-cat superfamily restriction endonuclease n=1 Tax=Demequina lutea TaxID=431489 RepID=A0A7Y9ZD07_9MICO|nr:hypothetical protein [Demequina lutea]NYI42620.1 putative Mrr-cat superfamily restriction endonuclease [Demequina lutea]
MTRYFRVSVGKDAAYLADALANNYVGTGWMINIDLTGQFADDWREFNKRFIPTLKETDHIESNVTAGLACGMTWTLGYTVSEGDVILVPTGQSSYRVARVTGPYTFTPGHGVVTQATRHVAPRHARAVLAERRTPQNTRK